MSVHQIGHLPLWRVPRVVGTITGDALLATAAGGGLQPECDMVEVRLDLAGWASAHWPAACEALEQAGYPVIFTLRAAAEGGGWTEADAARLPFYEQALARAAAIDIEYGSPLAPALCARAAERGRCAVVSFHDFAHTPPLAALQATVDGILKLPAAIPKVAAMVRNNRDIETLRTLLSWNTGRPMCVIGMGARGRGTRTSFPALGSCLTYGFLDGESAPGQMPAGELVAHLRASMPAFRADWAERHPSA